MDSVNQTDIIALIGQRTNEINTWIMVRNIIWITLLLAALWQISETIKANNKWRWVLIGSICVAWLAFEASCAYYLHVNGSYNDRLEKFIENKALRYEYSRSLENSKAKATAPIGFFLPYFVLFVLACVMLAKQPPLENGKYWMCAIIVAVVLAGTYYALLMWAATMRRFP